MQGSPMWWGFGNPGRNGPQLWVWFISIGPLDSVPMYNACIQWKKRVCSKQLESQFPLGIDLGKKTRRPTTPIGPPSASAQARVPKTFWRRVCVGPTRTLLPILGIRDASLLSSINTFNLSKGRRLVCTDMVWGQIWNMTLSCPSRSTKGRCGNKIRKHGSGG